MTYRIKIETGKLTMQRILNGAAQIPSRMLGSRKIQCCLFSGQCSRCFLSGKKKINAEIIICFQLIHVTITKILTITEKASPPPSASFVVKTGV